MGSIQMKWLKNFNNPIIFDGPLEIGAVLIDKSNYVGYICTSIQKNKITLDVLTEQDFGVTESNCPEIPDGSKKGTHE